MMNFFLLNDYAISEILSATECYAYSAAITF